MDTHRNVGMQSNEDTAGINLRKTFYSNMKTFETSNLNLGTQQCITFNSGKQEDKGENVQGDLLSFSNISFCDLSENKPACVEEKKSNGEPLASKHFEPEKRACSKSFISDKVSNLNWTLAKENRLTGLESYQRTKENSFAVSLALNHTSILTNKQNGNSSYSKMAQYLSSNLAQENHCFDCNIKKTISLQLTDQHCLHLHNLDDLWTNSCKKQCALIKLVNSREIVEYSLPSQINVCTTPESIKIAVGELIEQLLKNQSYINSDPFNKQVYNQVSLNVQKVVPVTNECLQISSLDSLAKYSLDNSTENALSNTNKLLGYPEINIDVKENPKILNQRNGLSFPSLEKFTEQVSKSTVEEYFFNSTMTLQIQQYNMLNNIDSASKCNQVKGYVLAQEDVSKRLSIRLDEVYLQKKFCARSNFKLKHYFNTQTNFILVGTSCKISAFNQLSEFLSNENSAENKLGLMKPKQILSDKIIANSTARIENSLRNGLNGEVKVIQNIISSPQNETNKRLTVSESIQLKISEVTNNISENYADVSHAKVQQLLEMISNNNSYTERDCSHQLKEQTYPRNAHISQLLEGTIRNFSHQQFDEKFSLTNKAEFSQEILNANGQKRKGVLACLNKKQCDILNKVELSNIFQCNHLCQLGIPISSPSDELISNSADSNKIAMDTTPQYDGKPLDDGYYDADIDKAIDESMNKYENVMCDKGVLATPCVAHKSSQTDKGISERKLSCKRCLKFDEEDLQPYKRANNYYNNREESNFSICKQAGTLNKEFTRTSKNVPQIISTDLSLGMSQNMKDNINISNLYSENSNVNEECSLYDEDMDVDDGFNWPKDSKEMHESKYVLSDHKVPVVEVKATRTTLIKSHSSFLNTPKKPILRVGLSRSARLKPLHHK